MLACLLVAPLVVTRIPLQCPTLTDALSKMAGKAKVSLVEVDFMWRKERCTNSSPPYISMLISHFLLCFSKYFKIFRISRIGVFPLRIFFSQQCHECYFEKMHFISLINISICLNLVMKLNLKQSCHIH
ncbi:hypothetical protein E2C01_026681 [Portunus trituberculatus]|uniref:Uncharacterized protein n=1 Tax=Portunus trituberculatus TaxID=210409 RepID=A0A5B7EJ95_PORTR|nr:hypothetical protein [Portunus trituberculatus]